MKKHFAIKALALVLTLLMVFGVMVSAIEDEPGTQSDAIDITVGEIIPVRQLVEDRGYEYTIDYNRNVHKVECSGAVRSASGDPYFDDGYYIDGECVYGAQVGQGSVTIYFFNSTPPLVVGFNVTAAAHKPIEKKISILMEDHFSIEPLLAEAGYISGDVVHYAFWDVFNVNGLSYPVEILSDCGIFTPPEFASHHNGTGESQILLNMKDGQNILIRVTVKDSFVLSLWDICFYFFFELIPDSFRMRSQEWPWNMLVLLFTPADWILNGVETLVRGTLDVTPALVF